MCRMSADDPRNRYRVLRLRSVIGLLTVGAAVGADPQNSAGPQSAPPSSAISPASGPVGSPPVVANSLEELRVLTACVDGKLNAWTKAQRTSPDQNTIQAKTNEFTWACRAELHQTPPFTPVTPMMQAHRERLQKTNECIGDKMSAWIKAQPSPPDQAARQAEMTKVADFCRALYPMPNAAAQLVASQADLAAPPEVFPETDGPKAMTILGLKVQSFFGSGRYMELDQYIEKLSKPDETFDDGRPRLAGVKPGLSQWFDAYKEWKGNLDRIAGWRKEYPHAYAADLVEAILWRSWAWSARGQGYANTVTEEGWTLYRERLGHARKILEETQSRGRGSPLWYELRLDIAQDLSADHEDFFVILNEGVKKYPSYLPLYWITTSYLSPRWGGSYEAVDAFAHAAVKFGSAPNPSTYARIYWTLSNYEGLEFDPFKDSPLSWPEMKRSFEDLMQKYPKSIWNLNGFASFACRANDGATYGTLRAKLGERIEDQAWPANYSVDVCDARLLKHT